MERPWLNRYPRGVRPHLTYPQVPAYQLIFESIATYPDRTALIFLNKKTSYRQLGEQIDRFAAALVHRFKLAKGARVGIMLPNCPQNVVATIGAMRAGCIPVQFNPMYTPREIAYQLQDSGCEAFLFLDLLWLKVKEALGLDSPAALNSQGPRRVEAVVTSIKDALPFPKNLLYPLKQKLPQISAAEATPYTALLKEPAESFTPVPVNALADPAVLLYTGGTTGVAKGVMLTHANLNANFRQIKEWLQRPEGEVDTSLIVMPIFHSYGFTASLGLLLSTGGTAILVPRFEPTDVLKLIDKYKPSAFPGVPTLYTALMNHPDVQKYDLKSIQLCVSAAAPCPVELIHRFEGTTGATILEGYGMTECSPVTHSNPITGPRKIGSVGLPYPDTEVRIIDLETGADLPVGQEGEVLIRGPQVMKGYWNKPEETAKVLQDGWLYSGDIGRMDEDGYLYIVDRKKDMIIAGGFNVYPREIDEVLYQHPAVLHACTVGVPDAYRGETVKAFVVKRENAPVTEAELLEFCSKRLAAYKRPRVIEFVPELPINMAGKVLRRVLLEREQSRAPAVTATQAGAAGEQP
ncbi:MAG TPA: long-chain fatty acid--CoA ligase [Symbiobacteriaceae bacterium]|nr:long-chain fatty acid--CoA ligase [Symbiobacteriaceae bacterium]